MLALSHVILHVGFCGAIARTPPETTVALHVHLADRIGRTQLDKIYRLDRGDEAEAIVEFDSAFGAYRLDVTAPKYHCSAAAYLYFISGLDRSISVSLADSGAPQPPVPTLLSGTAPQSFLYVQPTFVLFDKNQVACDKPLPQPLTTNVAVENDQDGYYVTLYADPSAALGSQQLALRLRTPTHQYHYVRLPISFPMPRSGWPTGVTLNVTEEMIAGVAGDPVNTLLCPKMWRTSAG